MKGATVRVIEGSTTPINEKVDLTPEKTWTRTVRAPGGGSAGKYTLELLDSSGMVLLRQTEREYDWTPESEIHLGPQKNWVAPEESKRTEGDWLQLAGKQELNGERLSAAKTYEKALEKYPQSFELVKASGRLLVSLKRFERAEPRLAAAHARHTTDAEISYYLGISEEALGDKRSALNSFDEALRSPEYRAAAALRLAEIRTRDGKLKDAEDLVQESIAASPHDVRAQEEALAIGAGDRVAAASTRIAKEALRTNPLSAFLQEMGGEPDLAHLAGDPYRTLNVAKEFARLGMYGKAIEILSRNYPTVPADQREPGFGPPQENPLVIYFRGFCREKLGQSGAADYGAASRLSTLYVFPSTEEDRASLEAALQFNARDASAHYLLGTWLFARAMTDEALGEWKAARELNPKIPALDASLGLALLHEKRDLDGALKAFQAGIKNDAHNLANYFSAVATMAILGRSARERVEALAQYPEPAKMPTALVYELALQRAEAGDFAGAKAVFRDRFFGREEGGTNVRAVWAEVNLLEATHLAKSEKCDAAVAQAKSLGLPVGGLDFTHDGMQAVLTSARTDYSLGELYARCGQSGDAERSFTQAASATSVSDVMWAQAGASRLRGYGASAWTDRLRAAASQAEMNVREGGASAGWWHYVAGSLQIALGENERGKDELREVFLLPETQMNWHLSSLELERASEAGEK